MSTGEVIVIVLIGLAGAFLVIWQGKSFYSTKGGKE